MSSLNYRHLHYFWVVAKEGGFAKASARLDMAVQTVSAQVKELERALGHQLLKVEGRRVLLTEAGEAAFSRAEEIFRIGQALPVAVRDAAGRRSVRLAVGFSDGISKLAARAILRPALQTPDLHLVCHDGEFEQLLAQLALHHLDLVLADRPAPPNPALRVQSERLASSAVDWYGHGSLVRRARGRPLAASLSELPVLLPTTHSVVRSSIDRWFEDQGIRPRLAGEFEDSALMAVFAAQGLGVFPVSRLGVDPLGVLAGLRLLGRCEEIRENVYAIRPRRGIPHPLVEQLLAAERAAESPQR